MRCRIPANKTIVKRLDRIADELKEGYFIAATAACYVKLCEMKLRVPRLCLCRFPLDHKIDFDTRPCMFMFRVLFLLEPEQRIAPLAPHSVFSVIETGSEGTIKRRVRDR